MPELRRGDFVGSGDDPPRVRLRRPCLFFPEIHELGADGGWAPERMDRPMNRRLPGRRRRRGAFISGVGGGRCR